MEEWSKTPTILCENLVKTQEMSTICSCKQGFLYHLSFVIMMHQILRINGMFLIFVFGFHHQQLKMMSYKNLSRIHALQVGKPTKLAV